MRAKHRDTHGDGNAAPDGDAKRDERPASHALRRRVTRATNSLSLRLLSIFALTTLASLAILIVFFTRGLGSQWRDTIEPHFVQYLSFLQQNLGDPPDPARAQALTARLPVTIVIYRGETLLYSSDQRVPDLHKLSYRRLPMSRLGQRTGAEYPEGLVEINRDRGNRNSVLRFTHNGYTVYYRLMRNRQSQSDIGAGPKPTRDGFAHQRGLSDELVKALLVLAVVMGASYWLIRRLLAPIGTIRHGVARMTTGDLGERIALRGQDDLAVLGNSIDTMAERIEAMLDAKRQLLLALSHELRSPLARARLALEMLPASTRRDTIEQDMREMQSLISEIIESEQLQQSHSVLNLSSVDLAALVNMETVGHEEVVVTLEGQPTAGAEPGTDDPFALVGDGPRLHILIRNLIANAMLHGRSPDGSAEVNLTLSATADELSLEVADKGPGIPTAELSRITDPLYRPDASRARSTGGFGLGLTLARLIAKAHGGELAIYSEPAIRPGTRVQVLLPTRQSA